MARGPADLRACYTVPELAEMLGLTRWKVARMLRRRGVPVDHTEHVGRVWLAELRGIAPQVWESLLLRASILDASMRAGR